MAQSDALNESYDPTDDDSEILDVFVDGRDEGEPWGRATPRYLMDETGLNKGSVEFSLRSLRVAGWIRRPSRGIYELVEDARDDDE